MDSTNLLGMLAVLKAYRVKPNFSELARNYGVSRQTVQRYWNDSGKKEITRNRPSVFEQFKEEIVILMGKTGVTKKSVYEFLLKKYVNIPNYSAFRAYTTTNNICLIKSSKPTVRFETAPGQQLQVDWKENIVLHSRSGQKFDFNILTSTLGYSRLHKFQYAKTRTTEEFIRCMCELFNELGGGVDHILTDNMPALVNVSCGKVIKLDKIIRFERESSIKIKLCKTRRPYTKGKVESANRFLSWLMAYDGEFDTEDELIDIISQINDSVNLQKNGTTKKAPIELFHKEKEYLKKLPAISLEKYVDNSSLQVVPSTQLVYFKGCGYSVPANCIGNMVKVIAVGGSLFLYLQNDLLTVHNITKQRFNYKTEHYLEGLGSEEAELDEEFARRVEENLKRLSEM
ncbi:MAG: IS21 family transposase [bacterium]